MSGGSFNYLYSADLVDRRGNIERMRDLLHEQRHHAAALRTAEVLNHMRQIQDLQEELSDVWHAAEWFRSGDYGPDHLAEAVVELAAKVPADAERVDLAKRLWELEQEAGALRRQL